MNAGIGDGCYVFVYHISNAPLELGIRSVFVSSGLSSHAGIFIFMLFLKLFKDGFSNLRTDSKCLTNSERTQSQEQALLLALICFWFFQTKTHCPYKERLGHSLGKRPLGEAMVLLAVWQEAERSERVLNHTQVVSLKCAVLFHSSHAA